MTERRGRRPARAGGLRVAVHRQVRLGGAELVPDIDRTDAWLLFVDGVPQSGVDLADPAYLEFEYIRRIGHVVDLAFPPGAPVHALHLGGGALTLPRYIAHTRPGSRQLVAEVDDALTDLVRARLPLPAGHRIRVRAADARVGRRVGPAGQLRPGDRGRVRGRGDAAPADHGRVRRRDGAGAAAGRGVRGQRRRRAAARPGPVGGGHGPFRLRGDVHDRGGERAQGAAAGEPGDRRQRRRALPLAGLSRACASDPFPARVVVGDELRRFASGAPVVTDAAVTANTTASDETSPQPTNW